MLTIRLENKKKSKKENNVSKQVEFVVLRNIDEAMRLVANTPPLSERFSNEDLFGFIYKVTRGSIYRKHMVGVILDAISKFVKSGGYPRDMDAFLSTKVTFIIGILVENEDIATEAKEFYGKMIRTQAVYS